MDQTKAAMLRRFREQYPFRLIRDRQFSPKPHEVIGLTGHYASFPMSGGVEWFFETDEDRKRFMKLYGGTEL